MADFWEALTKPVPFYTKENVQDTITYIKDHEAPAHNEYMLAALRWVLSVLQAGAICITYADERMIAAAAETAQKQNEKAVIDKAFIAAMRWRYAISALGDYINYLKGVRK